MTRIAIQFEPNTVGSLLREGMLHLQRALRSDPGATPELDAELLLAHALRVERTVVHSHPEAPVPRRTGQRFKALIERRCAGEPVAYLLGRKAFWTIELTVNHAVLVPRPETELLVERALARGPPAAGQVVDLGTGSGAIALALAHERAGWRICATDISGAALTVARANAAALGLERVRFVKSNWAAALAGHCFDLVVSNPPYIAADDAAIAGLMHEPRRALTPGPDALACLRQIIDDAPRLLVEGGWIVLEHGAAQGRDVAAALRVRGFATVCTHRDLAGHERVTEGQWPTHR
jgi:release factor glutamine methyltransferase